MKVKKAILTFLPAIALLSVNAQGTFTFGTKTNPKGETFEVDSKGFILNGKHVLPVMGEMHFSRVPASEWRREIRKMQAGGITILATYIFWIHHEEKEGKWDWSGNRNLNEFVRICGEEHMPVVLRIGPFCHGEVYQGGFPVWLTDKATSDPKNFKLRSTSPGFVAATERFYSNIFAQVNNLLWKHGGPIVGVQIENECRGPWAYYMTLKNMAVKIGFDTPFYTRTGWPKLNGKEEFGQMLPLYGDYADGFWDRKLTDMPGEYPQAFIMKDTRLSGVIATETFGTDQDTKMDKKDLQYPYLTCELGGGMMPSYHRRINISGREALPLAICKVGSGSNLPGYYMYHGGTNAFNPLHSMAEMQNSATTAHNDMPYMTYDFQCPLGEMGQPNETSFHQTRLFHQFLADWGEELSQYGVDSLSEHYARRGCFEFYNDYVRILNEQGNSWVRPKGMMFKSHAISADVQPFCKLGDCVYFIPIKGKKPVVVVDGKKYVAKLDKMTKHKDISFCVLSEQKARTAFVIDGELHFASHGGILYKGDDGIVEEVWQTREDFALTYEKVKEAAAPREIKMGLDKVAEQPSAADFDNAEVWKISLPEDIADASQLFLSVNYAADCARVYADGVLVMDNFWNGKPMLVRVSDLIGKKVELRILPLRKDAPIYLQKEQKEILGNADGNALLKLNDIRALYRRN